MGSPHNYLLICSATYSEILSKIIVTKWHNVDVEIVCADVFSTSNIKNAPTHTEYSMILVKTTTGYRVIYLIKNTLNCEPISLWYIKIRNVYVRI